MRRTLALALLTLSSAIAPAQTRVKGNELALELQTSDALDGIPQRIRLTLRNITDHDLRLPEPAIQCNGQYGSLWLHVNFKPAVPSRPSGETGYGCAADAPGENLTNPKRWITLAPGGYLDRWYPAARFHLQDQGAGRYDLQGEYLPPTLSPALTRSLTAEGILFVRRKVESNRLSFRK